MAVECALENSIANLIGPLLVANLANAFGYQFGRVEDSHTDFRFIFASHSAHVATVLQGETKDLESAVALGNAMAVTWQKVCISAGRVGEDSRFRKPHFEGSN